MMAFFFTMPISIRMPMLAMMVSSWFSSISAPKAPIAADGRPARMVSGWM